MEDWDFYNMVLHQLHLKKEELAMRCLYLRWTSLLPSPTGSYWHLTLWNPANHKCAHDDLKPSELKSQEIDGLGYKDYINWVINLMTEIVAY